MEFVSVDADDARAVRAALGVVRSSERCVRGRERSTMESLAAQLRSADTGPGQAWLAMQDGAAGGLLVLERSPGSGTVFLDLHVSGPSAATMASELLDFGVQRAAPLPGVTRLESASYGDDDVVREPLRANDFAEARRYWRMRRELAGVSEDDPAPPPGVDRRVVNGMEDLRILHRLREEVFRGSPGFESRSFGDYVAALDAVDGADPTGRWIASVRGQPVALCISDDSHSREGNAYLRTVGVVPEARGQGIARWLLDCAAAHAVRRGRAGILLTVDGRNTTGAVDLYLSAGYEVLEVIDVWERSVGRARESAESR